MWDTVACPCCDVPSSEAELTSVPPSDPGGCDSKRAEQEKAPLWLKPYPAVGYLYANSGTGPNQLIRVEMGVDHQEAQITRMLLLILALFFPTLLTAKFRVCKAVTWRFMPPGNTHRHSWLGNGTCPKDRRFQPCCAADPHVLNALHHRRACI